MAHQPTLGLDSVSQGLLQALMEDEKALEAAQREYSRAVANLEVIIRRYAAMREAVRERLGTSPYSQSVMWPNQGSSPSPRRPFRFRYTNMKIGDAIIEVLEEAEHPMTLEEITEALDSGGVYRRDVRSVNAALINTKGVAKLDDGRYILQKEDDVDDLPF